MYELDCCDGNIASLQPTDADLNSGEFNAIWNAIKKWDISRYPGCGYAGANGSDVMEILRALRTVGLLNDRKE